MTINTFNVTGHEFLDYQITRTYFNLEQESRARAARLRGRGLAHTALRAGGQSAPQACTAWPDAVTPPAGAATEAGGRNCHHRRKAAKPLQQGSNRADRQQMLAHRVMWR